MPQVKEANKEDERNEKIGPFFIQFFGPFIVGLMLLKKKKAQIESGCFNWNSYNKSIVPKFLIQYPNRSAIPICNFRMRK